MTLLTAQQLDRITHAVNDLTPAQLAWVGGYLSGMSLGNNNVVSFSPQVSLESTPEVALHTAPALAISTTILYGSQTGNSKGVAEKLAAELEAQGQKVSLKSLKDFRPQQLKKERRVFFVISTHGNGEPPDDARAFFQFINSSRVPKLNDVDFAVLALGDSSYDEFCQTGVDLDKRLEELGAKRWLDRIDCDVDYLDDANEWREQVVTKIQAESATENTIQFPSQSAVPATQLKVGTQEAPYAAELLASTPVTDVDSEKEVLHLELSLEDSGIQYQPGDIIAIKVSNEADLVAKILEQTGLNATAKVIVKKQELDLQKALSERLEISTVTRKQLQAYAQKAGYEELAALAADKEQLVDWLEGADWLDLLRAYPTALNAQGLVDLLRPLMPREYSIASSLEAHPEEVHVLVKRVQYQHEDREHLGAGSNWLARLEAGESAEIYIKPNNHFKLPGHADTKIIMIGAGTGVAPYRSFMAEREAKGLQGNSWLFFGEQRFRSDFLYQSEWLNLVENGVLERMSVAFSRDQAEKIYVQHRLQEEGADVWQWLQDGAHLYVCGDMHKMAKDVHAALLQIAIDHGGYHEQQAEAWLESLISEQRYQRDVY